MAIRVAKSAVVIAYFFYWDWRARLRHYLKVGAIGILALSGALLLLEVLFEIAGRERITVVLSGLDRHTGLRYSGIVLFVLASFYILFHHLTELRKPSYEYAFIKRLCRYLESHHLDSGIPLLSVKEVLELFHSVFSRVGIAHVSIAREKDGWLTIDPREVFPEERAAEYFERLKVGQGVAGLVAR